MRYKFTFLQLWNLSFIQAPALDCFFKLNNSEAVVINWTTCNLSFFVDVLKNGSFCKWSNSFPLLADLYIAVLQKKDIFCCIPFVWFWNNVLIASSLFFFTFSPVNLLKQPRFCIKNGTWQHMMCIYGETFAFTHPVRICLIEQNNSSYCSALTNAVYDRSLVNQI